MTARRWLLAAWILVGGVACAAILDIKEASVRDGGVDSAAVDGGGEGSSDPGVLCGSSWCTPGAGADAGCCLTPTGARCGASCPATYPQLTCDDKADCPLQAPCCFRIVNGAAKSQCDYPCDASVMCNPNGNDCANSGGLVCRPVAVTSTDGGYYTCQ